MHTSEKELITAAFTDLAPSYLSTMDAELSEFWGVGYMDFVKKLLDIARVQPGERVLDIATGTAAIPLQLKSQLPGSQPVFGLDITPAMLNSGRKNIQRKSLTGTIDLVCASAMVIPFASRSFDVAICALGTHHMDVPQMLSEVRRVLVNGGRLVISDVGATPFWRSIFGKLLLLVLLQNYRFSHSSSRTQAEIEAFKNVRTAEEWKKLLSQFGFRQIHIDEIKPRLPWYPCGLTMAADVINIE